MSQVCRILRVVGYFRQAQRYYSARRRDYYEILGLKSGASKEDIRAAYLNISKKVHPDAGNTTDHAEFVRVTEAYNILSKDPTRQAYDTKLNSRKQYRYAYYEPFDRTIYHNRASHFEQWRDDNRRRSSAHHDSADPFAMYRRTASQQFPIYSKTKIVFLCLVVSTVAFLLQILAVVRSPTLDRQKMLERSAQLSKELEKVRERGKHHASISESIDSFVDHLDSQDE